MSMARHQHFVCPGFACPGTLPFSNPNMDWWLSPAGRKPFTEGLGLEDVGVKTDNRGRIEVDDHFNTSVKVCHYNC